MVCAFECPPLVRSQPAFQDNGFKVATRLDEPLTARVDVRELFTLAAVLDAAAERAERVKGAAPFTGGPRLARLEQLCRVLAPQQKAPDTLAALGLFDFYPHLAAALCGHVWGPGVAAAGVAYLNYVSLLNQVVMMSTQLYNDAVVPSHHKYSAHQVALLYQSLNMLQGDTKPIRRLIEARFDEIKAITEGGRPTLPPDAATWLQQVTWVCREEVAACPAYIHKRLAPLVTMLKAGCQRSSSGGGGDAAAAAQQPQAAVGLAAAAAQQQQSVYGAPAQQQQSCAVQEQQQATNYYQQQHYQAYSAAAH